MFEVIFELVFTMLRAWSLRAFLITLGLMVTLFFLVLVLLVL